MIIRKIGFTTNDFDTLTLPELYLRLCITLSQGRK